MRIFVYESVTAGDLGDDVPASLMREGQAMLDAVVADFRRLSGVEVAMLTKATGTRFSERAQNAFFEQAALADATLVIAPEFDSLLHDLSRTVLQAGGHLLGSLPDGIQLTGDKLALAEFWQERRVPHPATRMLDATDQVGLPFPWVVKPRFGAGSQATFLIRHDLDLMKAFAPAYHECPEEDFIVQTFVPGQAAGVALLMSAGQTIPLQPAQQHLSRDGRFHYLGGSLPLPEPLASRAVKLALQAVAGIDGLGGYVGVDLVLGDNGNDYAIEINPRLTTSYLGLRQLCKQNLAELILRLVQGETLEPPTWLPGSVRFEPGNDSPSM